MITKIYCTLIQGLMISVIAVHAVPASYCFYPINKTDCGLAPTPVFSYYKSGSRCEIEIWRGCPSYNRFDSFTTCSHYCIGRLNFEENEIEDGPCEGKLNNGNCGSKPTTVYTYNRNTDTCEMAQWSGCKTSNKFDTEKKCREDCMRNKNPAWEDTLKKMSNQDISDMNKLVDEILKDDHHEKLKNVHVHTTEESITSSVTYDLPEEVDSVR